VNQEESQQDTVDGMKEETNSTGRLMHIEKSGLVICNEKDADGHPRVSTAGSTC